MPRPTRGTDVHVYNFIDHLTPFFCRNNIHPNVVTLFGILVSFLMLSPRLTPLHKVAIFMFIRFLDCLDGEVARQCKKTSKIGAYLDSAMDVISGSVMLIAAFKIKPTIRNVAMICVASWVIVSRFVDPLTHETSNPALQIMHDNCVLSGTLVAIGAFYLGKK